MDDTVKGITLGLIAVLVFHGALDSRARRATVRQMREAFPVGGSIRASIQPEPPLGLFANEINTLDIYGDHVASEHLPFTQIPRSGIKGHIHHLRLHLTNSSLRGLALAKLEVDIPSVTYDLGWAINKDRLLIRSAGEGTIGVWIQGSEIKAYAAKKYSRTLANVNVSFQDDHIVMHGELILLGTKSPFSLTGRMASRSGRYIDVVEPEIMVNSKPMSAAAAAGLMSSINPILDIDRDFQLGDFVSITQVISQNDLLLMRGIAKVPFEKKTGSRSLSNDSSTSRAQPSDPMPDKPKP